MSDDRACLACGASGYGLFLATGKGKSRLCRYCFRNPALREQYREEAHRASSRESMSRAREAERLRRQTIVRLGFILGPAPCRACGLFLGWNGLEWQDYEAGRRHVCRKWRIAA